MANSARATKMRVSCPFAICFTANPAPRLRRCLPDHPRYKGENRLLSQPEYLGKRKGKLVTESCNQYGAEYLVCERAAYCDCKIGERSGAASLYHVLKLHGFELVTTNQSLTISKDSSFDTEVPAARLHSNKKSVLFKTCSPITHEILALVRTVALQKKQSYVTIGCISAERIERRAP